MDDDAAIQAFAEAAVARLSTIGPDGPHLVPIVFALVDGACCTALDHKPKSTTNLRRLRNVRRDPRVSVLVDHYVEDWSRLWWVRLDGLARIVDVDDPVGGRAVEALVGKYEQYRSAPPMGPVIVIEPVRWTHWGAR